MIREPAVAGTFYAASASALHKTVGSLLEGPADRMKALAVIAPHAGYMYSGAVAGSVFSAVQLPRRFILLGPNHTGRGVPFSLHPPGEWRTPLGLALVDRPLNEQLLQECSLLREDRAAHVNEHAIEVQLPFLQAQVEGMSFSAICVGSHDLGSLLALGRAMGRVVQASGEPLLMVASSDMTHYESAEVATRKDRLAIDRVLSVDPEGLYRTVLEEDISMCGFSPAVAVLVACRDLGATAGKLIRYANSGDVSGDYEHVVGYAGMAVL
jgi:AmmeMemoRadiSam system protein B